MPREQTPASALTRAISETRTQADISLLPTFTDRLMHTLTDQHGAEAPQTRLAGHLLWPFAYHLAALAAEPA